MKAAVISVLAACVLAAAPERPELLDKGRIKHRPEKHDDEETSNSKRKIFAFWDRVPGATMYEICHQCRVNDANGFREDKTGHVHEVDTGHTCNGEPCWMIKGTPAVKQRFNLRV